MTDQPEHRYTATVDEVADVDATIHEQEAVFGTGTTEDAEDLPQEFDELTDDAISGDLDRDDQALAKKMRQLENDHEVTDADEAGIEGSIKSLDFNEAEGDDGVDFDAPHSDS